VWLPVSFAAQAFCLKGLRRCGTLVTVQGAMPNAQADMYMALLMVITPGVSVQVG
jgi:hypothetical protein